MLNLDETVHSTYSAVDIQTETNVRFQIESSGLRVFCWNCIVVNFLFTMFLAVRVFLVGYALKRRERCYYDDGIPQIMYETNELLGKISTSLD